MQNRAVGQTNLSSDTANDFYITGVQLEVNTTATPFEHLQYTTQLQLCQRYFRKFVGYISVTLQNSTLWSVEMRATPTLSSTATGFSAFSPTQYGASLIATSNSASATTTTDAEL